MPFDDNKWSRGKMFAYEEMLTVIEQKFPGICGVSGHLNDTSKTYQVPGFAVRVGFITSMTHNFCGSCNWLRITSDGNLKMCLFGKSEVSLRDILRSCNGGQPVHEQEMAVMKEHAPGHKRLDPESSSISNGMREKLLPAIGSAVKRKKRDMPV